jgi:hypothetical protein
MFSAATKSARGPNAAVNYIEDVFSTYLYTGTGAAQTITNNINLSTKGGLAWIKSRSDATNNNLFDTTQGATKLLHSNLTDATATDANSLTAFNSTGFTLGTGSTASNEVNVSAATYCSWSFAKQAKFFDVVTYTGNSVAGRTISHNLGSVPGMIIVKCTSTASTNWAVYHTSTGATQYLNLNTFANALPSSVYWNNTAPTSSVFSVGAQESVNSSGYTYVAYLFAHNAGGFGLTGTDNVISCGSYTGNGSATGTVINLGYEPQYVLIKCSSNTYGWWIFDSMRGGLSLVGYTALQANTSDAESASSTVQLVGANATGFQLTNSTPITNGSGETYIYMAIRRPMKVPTDATTVFKPVYQAGYGFVTTNFVVDLNINTAPGLGVNRNESDRLRGSNVYLNPNGTSAETNAGAPFVDFTSNIGIKDYNWGSGNNIIYYNFARRPGFFDVVCYTGTGSATTQAHNLGVVPELMIVKERSAVNDWWIYHSATGNTNYSVLNTTAIPVASSTAWNNTTPTASVFSIGTGTPVNASTQTYVAYLFATCPGVSKVGTYTGNGTTQAIACGFTGGARFVLIKRTDAAGDWYTYDTARGMTTVTDPYLLLNSATAQSASLGSVTSTTGGFTVNAAVLAAINTNAATYIFLAIA